MAVVTGHTDNNNNETNQGEIIRDWLQTISKSLDFVFLNQPQTELSVEEALSGCAKLKVCDPYCSAEEPPLNKRISLVDSSSRHSDLPCGQCYVRLTNGEEMRATWQEGKRCGPGKFFSPRLEKLGVSHLVGSYKDGILTGHGALRMTNGTNRDGWFQQGYFHGPVRGREDNGRLNYVGWYRAGIPHGPTWLAVRGDGWLVGELDEKGEFTGDDIVFLYPDLSTALIGKFHQGEVVSVRAGTVEDITFRHSVLIPKVRITDEKQYHRWISTNKDIVCPVDHADPYETTVVQVKQSIMQDAGEGLFARVDLPAQRIISYYNGLRMEPGEGLPEDTGYAIFVELNSRKDKKAKHMDIPQKYQRSENYSATLAHKLNHSFDPNCWWDNAEHPVHGLVPAIRTLKSVKAGEELTIHYMMDMEGAADWYKTEWEKHSLRLVST